MSLTQGIILYFFIMPVVIFIAIALIEEKRELKEANKELLRKNKILNRKLNYIRYIKLERGVK